MDPLILFILGAVGFVILHRALEGLVVDGDHAARRKFLWDLGTAGLLVAGLAGVWVFAALNVEWRAKYGTVLFIATPVMVIGAAVFGYISYYVYSDEESSAKGHESEC